MDEQRGDPYAKVKRGVFGKVLKNRAGNFGPSKRNAAEADIGSILSPNSNASSSRGSSVLGLVSHVSEIVTEKAAGA